MSSTNPLSRKMLKGALVKLDTFLVVPVPEIIIFQYNPATLTRAIAIAPSTPPTTAGGGQQSPQAATAQPQPPVETITMALEFDAADSLESPESHPVAMLTGVADRIAALEMLLYPSTSGNGLLGDLAASLGIGGSSAPVPPERSNVPLTFLVWGPGRILPVRITTFSVEEQEFMTMLYPLRAKVSLTLQILRENDYAGKTDELSTDLAKAAWKFYRTQQQVLAVANIANSVESILGMLPI